MEEPLTDQFDPAEHQARYMEHMRAMPDPAERAEYQDRFVAFADILGFRNLMNGTASQSPNDLFRNIVDSYWFHSANNAVDIQLWSDSIVIVSRSEAAAEFIVVANALNNFRNSFLERGFLLRGGVAFGRHFQRGGIWISPALIEAAQLEKDARDPRFICGESTFKRVLPQVTRNRNGRVGIPGAKYFFVARDQLPVPDHDGQRIIEFLPDTLEPYYLRTGHHHDPTYEPTADQVAHFNSEGRPLLWRWRNGLLLAVARAIEPKHKEKVEYAIMKWNAYIDSFKKLAAPEIASLKI